jgi:Uma2 family endonuclease
VTADALFRLTGDHGRYALVKGELLHMTPAGFAHGAVVANLTGPLLQHVKAHRLGIVCGAETGFVLARDPDTVLAPDVAFVRRERIPASGAPATFWNGAPDLAVEVVSPGDTRPEVASKVDTWLAAGALVVWVADPRDSSVTIHQQGRAPQRLTAADTLDGAPLLPDFRLPVPDVFAL